jgi:hypothetical protein
MQEANSETLGAKQQRQKSRDYAEIPSEIKERA